MLLILTLKLQPFIDFNYNNMHIRWQKHTWHWHQSCTHPRLLDRNMFKKRLFPWFSHQHKSVKLFKTVIHYFGSLQLVFNMNKDLYKIPTFFNVTALVIILILNFQYFCPPFPPFFQPHSSQSGQTSFLIRKLHNIT